MPPTKSCIDGLAPRGTAWYYATFHLGAQPRHDLLVLQAWWRAVRDIPFSVSEPDVAAAKLAWWEAQVRQSGASHPDHPLLRALLPALRAAAVPPEQLLQPLAQVRDTLQQSRWLDWQGVQAHLDNGPGQVARVACMLTGQTSAAALDYAGSLGTALALVGMVRDIGRDVRRGMILFPVDALAAHGVKARQLLAREDCGEVRALLRQTAAKARDALLAAEARRPHDMGRTALPGIALTHMALALLREMEREDYALLGQRISLAPTRLLWASWRAKWMTPR